MKKSNQQGFTLVELIIVIVILGVLAVTAAPKFLDIKSDAVGGTLDGVKTAMVGVINIEKSRSIINTGSESEPTALQVGSGLELQASDWVVLYDADRTGTPAPTKVRVYPAGQELTTTTGGTATSSDGAFPTTAGAGFDCYVEYTGGSGLSGITVDKNCD